MAEQKELITRIRHKVDSLVNWESSELILLKGELAFVAEDGRYKIGDGSKKFRELSYATNCSVVETKAPTPSDIKGVGTFWTDTTTQKIYVCLNIAEGTTATWKELGLAENYYTKTEIDQKFEEGGGGAADLENYYNKTEVDGLLENKVDQLKFTTELAKKASLGEDGKVPASQLPSYVDDVVEFENRAGFPESGEENKIYVAKDTNIIYRWSGSDYVEISASLAIGETGSTAFAGDRGKALEDRIALLGDLANKNTVSTTEIDNNAVTTEKINDGAVTDAKIASLNVNKLTQDEGDVLILDCGDSTVAPV